MTRPSLLANPIMGLTSDRPLARELIAHHRHVYFSDLRELTATGMTLTDRLFYGCFVAPGTFSGAALVDTRFVCCAGAGEQPANAEVCRAIEDGLRGEWDRAWALLEKPTVLARDVVEHLVAVTAVGTIDPRKELRLGAMERVARLLREHSALLPADSREALGAFLLYRAADDSDMVYFDAIHLVDDLKLSQGVLEHLVGRARSLDPRERIDALVARERMRYSVESMEPPYPPLAELLEDEDPNVQLALLDFLSQCVRFATDELIPGIDVPEKLNPLLRSGDDRVRRAALRYARYHGGSSNRQAFLDILHDSDETLRDLAFEALYITLQEDELRDFLLHHEPTPAQRATVLAHEAHTRNREHSYSLVADSADLRTMLASDDPRQRRDALLLAGFTGDPALIPDVERALGDADPRVRAEAERLLPQLREIRDNEASREPLPTYAADSSPVVIITAGAGGEQAHNFVQVLFRMYSRWAEAHHHPLGLVELTGQRDSTVSFTTSDTQVFDLLKGETGTHRIVAFDDQYKRRYTAFAYVSVLPDGRRQPPDDTVAATKEGQIRTYTLHPVPRVVDHRTGFEVADAQAVLDGDLDPFIRAFVAQKSPEGTA